MTADALLDTLVARGASLAVEDGRLRVRAGRGVITPELKDQIAALRDALVARLVERADPHGPFPLTDIQGAYLVGRTDDWPLGGVACHLYHELDGPALDPAALERAWKAVVARHPALRTVVRADGRQQVLADPPPWSMPVHDLRDRSPAEIDAALAATRERLSTRCADPHAWPLFALEVSLLPDDRCRVHLDFDLLPCDASGMLVTLDEWRALYHDPDAPLPPASPRFREVVLRSHAERAGEAYRTAEAWWDARLDALPPPPELPLARRPETLSGVPFRRHAARIDADRWAAIAGRARRFGLTPSNVIGAAFAEVLAAWSGHRPFTLALTLFRPPADVPAGERLVGEFTTTTLLEVDPGGATFAERAVALRDRLAADLEHAACGGVAALRAHARRTGVGRHFPVVLTSLLSSTWGDFSDGMSWLGEVAHAISQTPQVWIDHQVLLDAGGLRLSWDVPEGLFPEGLIEDAFAALVDLLGRLADGDDPWRAPRFDLLPPSQRARRALYDQTEAPLPEGRLFDAFCARAAEAPDRVAVIGPDATLSYGALEARARRVAHALAAYALAPGEPVAIALARGAAQVAAVLGVHFAGGAYVPLDADWPAARLAALCHGCGARVVLVDQATAAVEWPEGVDALPFAATARHPASRAPAPQKPDDRAYIIHTSGSTGAPKGVVMAHRATLNTVDAINRRFAVGPDDRVLSVSSLAFDLSVYDLFGPLAVGGAVVMLAPERARDPHHWMQVVEQHRVTLWNSVPALFELFVEACERTGRPAPGALRAALLSGDWVPTDLPDRGRALWPAARIDSLGGATEAAIWSIAHPTDALEPGAPSVPYGRPLPNQRVRVLDPHFAPSPEWVPGELYLAGAGLADGYWRDPTRTAERFVRHPETGERLYRTGDLGRFVPAGHIEFLGRVDSQVKVNGHRIELGEIEAALRTLPGVRDAVVDAPGERHRRRLVAWVVPADPAAPPTGEALRAGLAARLPAAMVPRIYGQIAAVPLGANGKVDRGRLPPPPSSDISGESSPESSDAMTGMASQPAEAPADDALGRVLAAIAEVMPGLAIGPEDDLVRAGANSVDLIRLGTRLNEAFGARPPMAEILRRGTAAALAQFYRAARVEAPPAPPAGPALPMLLDPAAREAHKAKRLGLRPVDGPAHALERPPSDAAAWLDRRSQRRFVEAPVPSATLGRWLAALCPLDLGGDRRWRHASAGDSRGLRTYLHLRPGAVEGLPGGGFYHDPVSHRLAAVGDGAPLPATVHAPTNRPWIEAAPLILFFVAERRAIEPLYGPLWRDFALLEAGARTHLLEETALACGLGACQIGDFDRAAVAAALALGETEAVLHALAAGGVAFDEDVI